ncbi:MAG TPA: molybdopterin-binding protein [Polyangiaceae bacterium]|nr:molybdopterin-binding protein [Polyangiaceae bacterium]
MEVVVAESAVALIVGNELLSGKVAEANLLVLARTLRPLGVRLARATFLPDDLPLLAREIRALSDAHPLVFTSGGVGPTHDDVTIEAVSQAFGTRSVEHPYLAELIRGAYGERCTPDHLRMALVPEGATLAEPPAGGWPTPVFANVWMLPGVPEVFREKLDTVRAWVRGPAPFASRAVYTRLEEAGLKGLIDAVVAGHPDVEVGSYPRWFEPSYKTKITFDARDPEAVERGARAFVAALPEGALVRVE